MTIEHYTYRITWSPEDGEYAATCLEFPSLSWMAEDQVEALTGLQSLVQDVVADMEQNGERVPAPLADQRFSGRFQVRVPPELHRQLALEAAEANMSLNRLVTHKLEASG